jgi:hypothetical protein
MHSHYAKASEDDTAGVTAARFEQQYQFGLDRLSRFLGHP